MVPFNLSIELVGNKYKTAIGLLFHIPYAIGQVLLSLVAIGVRDYKMYQILLSLFCFVLLGVYFLIPESPRWLIAKRKYKKAKNIINAAAKFNKVSKLISTSLLNKIIAP